MKKDEGRRPYTDEEFEDLIMPEEEEQGGGEKSGGSLAAAQRTALALHVIMAVLVTGFLYKSGYLPSKYLLAGAAILAVTVLISLPFHLSKSAGGRAAGTVISILLCLVMGFGLFYLVKVNRALNTITTQTQELSTFVVVVKTDDPAASMEDTAGYAFAASQAEPQGRLDEFRTILSSESGQEDVTILTYESPAACVQAILDGKTEAAVYNEGYTATLEEVIQDYSEQIRVLYRFDLAQAKAEAEAREEEKEEEEQGRLAPSVERPFTVYISGIDVEGPITTTSRSDVNIIMTINPYTHRILLTTTPRDYYVYIPGVSGEQRDKLTHAGVYGISASMATLEQLYGIQIDYYVRVNFTSLITIVDALGGVDVYSDYAFSARGYSFHAGTNHLGGEAALVFSRERYAFAAGDNQRGKNQEAVLTAIIDKVTSPEVLLHASDLIETASSCTQTSVSREEINTLVRKQLDEGGRWDVASQAVSGKGDSQATYSMGSMKLYVMWPDEESVETAAMRMNEVLAQEQ